MEEYYKIIGDIDELKWYFDNCIEMPKTNEAFAFCLSARNKMLSEEERKEYCIGRSEMLSPQIVNGGQNFTFEKFAKGVYRYECNKNSYTTNNGKFYPDKCLALYICINPCDTLKVIKQLKEYINSHEEELISSAMKSSTSGIEMSIYKLTKTLSKMKSLYFCSPGTKYWVDFDMDLTEEIKHNSDYYKIIQNAWRYYLNDKIGKGNYVIVSSTGGNCHTLVKSSCIKFNPTDFINDFTKMSIPDEYRNTMKNCYFFADAIEELIYNKNAMMPCPGTYQYGNVVRILNKEDFN